MLYYEIAPASERNELNLFSVKQCPGVVNWNICWRIYRRFSAFSREINCLRWDRFFSISKTVLPPCCVLWSWIWSESDLFGPHPTPERAEKPKA